MILKDLRKIDGCPERGVNVTVYGGSVPTRRPASNAID
jgi:hypothetical protein